jgi:hypothetical protein
MFVPNELPIAVPARVKIGAGAEREFVTRSDELLE